MTRRAAARTCHPGVAVGGVVLERAGHLLAGAGDDVRRLVSEPAGARAPASYKGLWITRRRQSVSHGSNAREPAGRLSMEWSGLSRQSPVCCASSAPLTRSVLSVASLVRSAASDGPAQVVEVADSEEGEQRDNRRTDAQTDTKPTRRQPVAGPAHWLPPYRNDFRGLNGPGQATRAADRPGRR